MKSKTIKKLRKLDREAREVARNRHFDKDKDKAALEKTMFEISDVAKKEGVE